MTWLITPSFTPWTPALITTALWLDAADATTLFTTDAGSTLATTGGTVGRWQDKSGNNRHVTQATSGARPTYQSNSLNAKPSLRFVRSGTSDALSTSNSGASGAANVSFIVLLKYVSVTSDDAVVWFGAGTSNAGRILIRPNGGSFYRFDTYTNGVTSNLAIDVGSYHFVSAVQSGQLAYMWRDGVADSTIPRTISGTIQNIGSNTFVLGGYLSGAYSDCEIAEGIFFYNAITDDTRQRIEGYLAHKWGLTANLPADHPYKVNAPAP